MQLRGGFFCALWLFSVGGSYGGEVSLYQYFAGEGITEGLVANGDEFRLNGKDIKIFSGSFHYFRVHPKFWKTRLQQYKAAGLNAVSVYVPWNLHEPQRGEFDFGSGSSQFSPFLNITRFLEFVMEEDMFAIFRPGPYICGEWEFGGLPSWLLHDQPMFLRSSFAPYQERAEIILHEIISRVKHLQFFTESGSKGGPIIMTQIENEYGNSGYGDHPRDKEHLRFLKSVLRQEGVESLLFTSDNPTLSEDWGNIDYELMTANFRWDSEENLKKIKELRPNSPILVSEFWPGWFDHWFEQYHNTLSEEEFRVILGNIFNAGASVNFYMFHGGTNFAFMNGGNIIEENNTEVFPFFLPDVTSYDYDAPLTESGQYTAKYNATLEMITAYDPLYDLLYHPPRPAIPPTTDYPDAHLYKFIPYWDIIEKIPEESRVVLTKPTAMEMLDINNGNGQSFGYIVYRKTLPLLPGMVLKIRGHPRDLVTVLVNGVAVTPPILTLTDLKESFGSWSVRDAEYELLSHLDGCEAGCTLDLMVENLGRVNFGHPHDFDQRKGLWEGDILLDDQPLDDWEHIAMEMKPDWLASLDNWQPYTMEDNRHYGPRLLGGSLFLDLPQDVVPQDTYFDFDCEDCLDWMHGAVFVNGFNIGRYHQAGPQKTLYIPGPILLHGENQIIVFENYLGSDVVRFTDIPNYGSTLH